MTHREEKLVAHERLEHLPRLLGFAAREADDDREEAEEACNAIQRNPTHRTAAHLDGGPALACVSGTASHEGKGLGRTHTSV